MKKRKQTSNAERPTPNAQREKITFSVAESNGDYRTTEEKRAYDLEERLLQFTADLVQLIDSLPDTKTANHVAGQLLRCGTSPLANHGEVEAAESRKDFLHKLGICLKELRETKRWLRLIHRLSLTDPEKLRDSFDELDQLIRIFAASIRTAKQNSR